MKYTVDWLNRKQEKKETMNSQIMRFRRSNYKSIFTFYTNRIKDKYIEKFKKLCKNLQTKIENNVENMYNRFFSINNEF